MVWRVGLDVKEVLTEHCRAYCGAQNLLVVALGTQSLNKLEKMVKKTFGKVPRAPKDAPDYSTMGLPFQGVILPSRQAVHFCYRNRYFSRLLTN